MRLRELLKFADFFTLANAVSGVLSIFFSLNKDFLLSSIMMLIAVFFDAVDGRLARWLKQENEFGRQLDSLSDIISFGVAPAVFAYSQGLTSLLAIIILSFFVVCGVLRLARFNIIKTKEFIGVPITTNGYLFPLVFLIFGEFKAAVLLVYAAMSALMISSLKIPKW
ncbi:MAG: CDP-diacylglycerol--serine O-phosphatidyltransferase [Candidatus Woesearchaeota archaeon]